MQSSDYSRDADGEARPHDLVWIEPWSSAASVPDWVEAARMAGAPVVVRRAPRRAGRLPIGVRGPMRSQRHADWIDPGNIRSRITPEGLIEAGSRLPRLRQKAIPALAALAAVTRLLDATGLLWGVTGAAGHELATGDTVCHAESDLDLLLRMPAPITRAEAATLLARLTPMPVRCDVQFETPAGGVALAEWAGSSSKVLVKSDQGPFLAANPWTCAMERASSCVHAERLKR